MEKIFVAISAYNEPDLEQTIENCLENAKYPDRIYFGISTLNNDGQKPNVKKYKNASIVYLNYKNALGTTFGRLTATMLKTNEDFYFQIDAHMLFDKDWDETVINYYNLINKTYEKPIISSYVPWWSRAENGEINFYSPINNSRQTPLIVMPEWEIQAKDSFLRITGGYDNLEESLYKEHHLVSAHFIFTKMSFIEEVSPDPYISLIGEEPTTALRAWTRGYRIFYINKAIAWHKNKWDGQRYKYDRVFYEPAYEKEGRIKYFAEFNARIKVMAISLGKIIGYWGAPNIELLKKYEQESGINYNIYYDTLRRMCNESPGIYTQTEKMIESYDLIYGKEE